MSLTALLGLKLISNDQIQCNIKRLGSPTMAILCKSIPFHFFCQILHPLSDLYSEFSSNLFRVLLHYIGQQLAKHWSIISNTAINYASHKFAYTGDWSQCHRHLNISTKNDSAVNCMRLLLSSVYSRPQALRCITNSTMCH